MRCVTSRRLAGCGALALGVALLSAGEIRAQALMRPTHRNPNVAVPLRPPATTAQPGLAPDGLLAPSAGGGLDVRGLANGSLPGGNGSLSSGSFGSLSARGQPRIAGMPSGPFGAAPTWNPYMNSPYGSAYPYPFAGNPYAYNPYGGMSPYGGFPPYGMSPYGGMPPYGGFNPYGGFGMPYGGMNPALGGVNPFGF